jgi:uncharacterized coiled-coil protein SlyX
MTKLFNLDFHGTRFAVPKGNLLDLFEHHPELVGKGSYEVQGSVPLEIFEIFARSLETGTKVSVTKENAGPISVLAKEFCLGDLFSECSAPETAAVPELIAALSERISKLENQISSQPVSLAELRESIANHERQLESLDCRISVLEPNLKAELKELKRPIATPTPVSVPPVSPSSHSKQSSFRLRRPSQLRESFPILLGNTGEMFTTKELSRLLQSRFIMVLCRIAMVPSMLRGISLISLLTCISAQTASQVSGFAGMSKKCASARLITQSKVTA